jgi:uncharacterized membrane protein YfcA
MIDLGNLSPWLLLAAPVAIVLGYIVFGLSGFGATAITVPILAHFLPVSYLVPLVVVLDLGVSTLVGRIDREHLAKDELKRLVPWMLAGFALGATVLVGVPDAYLRLALGIFSAVIGIHAIANPTVKHSISSLWAVPAGLVGGAVATVFGAGGPIYATYLSGRSTPKDALRATVATMIAISAFSRAIIYAVSGLLLHVAILAGVVVLAPFVWVGVAIGRRIQVGLSQQQMRRVIGTLMVFIGGSLVVRAISSWT